VAIGVYVAPQHLMPLLAEHGIDAGAPLVGEIDRIVVPAR
jgi:hypothetical protein